MFIKFGEIENVVVLKTKESTRYQGCGFVRFTSVADAARAIHELNGKHVLDEVCVFFCFTYIVFLGDWTIER